LYGIAEFRGDASEPEEDSTIPIPSVVPTASTISGSAPVSTSKPPTVVDDDEHDNLAVGYSVLQKGLFFAVILGCIVVYLKMNSKKNKRLRGKSMV